jgi:hypothetical protein
LTVGAKTLTRAEQRGTIVDGTYTQVRILGFGAVTRRRRWGALGVERISRLTQERGRHRSPFTPDVLRLAWFGRRLAAERLRLIARRARQLKLLKLM